MKNATNNGNISKALVIAALSEMPRKELSATAKQAGIPVGKSRSNTIANVANAIFDVKGIRCTVDLTIRKGESSAVSGHEIFRTKFRSARAATPLRSAIVS